MRHGELAEAEVITAIARQSISSELTVIYGKQSGCDTKRGWGKDGRYGPGRLILAFSKLWRI